MYLCHGQSATAMRQALERATSGVALRLRLVLLPQPMQIACRIFIMLTSTAGDRLNHRC